MSNMVDRLTPEDEERIRQEEIFRHEVQESLQKKRGGWGTAWSGLNSPVIVLLFGSFVIGGATWAIRNALNHRAEARQERLAAQQLASEIDTRLGYLWIKVQEKEKQTRGPNDPTLERRLARYVAFYLRSPGTEREVLSILPAYHQQSVLELVQLLAYNSGGTQRKRAEDLRTKVLDLYLDASNYPIATSAHEPEPFPTDLTQFGNGLLSGKYQTGAIVK